MDLKANYAELKKKISEPQARWEENTQTKIWKKKKNKSKI